MNTTPNANRIRIGIFGRTNSGKSTLMNLLCDSHVSIVSEMKGTTTDPVSCAVELPGIGACLITDTAGLDDTGITGRLKADASLSMMKRCDVALFVVNHTPDAYESEWISRLCAQGIPMAVIYNIKEETQELSEMSAASFNLPFITLNLLNHPQISLCHNLIAQLVKPLAEPLITARFVREGGMVILVMPQDESAPKGRLILPQSQVIRELMQRKCIVIGCVPENLSAVLKEMQSPPDLVITDSRVVSEVFRLLPSSVALTTFSILFASLKGDIDEYLKAIGRIHSLDPSKRILIAEACRHAVSKGDIGREEIPRLLRLKMGAQIGIDTVSGTDFPDNLAPYSLIIQCGGCMTNRRTLQTRIQQARNQGVPITNYGIFLAWANNILRYIRCQ